MSLSIIPSFYFSDKSNFEEAISIATYQYEIVNEDYFHCIKRERGKEILVLRDLNLPYIVYSIDNNNTILLESNFDINSINKDNSRVLFRGYAKLSNIFGIERVQTVKKNSKKRNKSIDL